MIPRRQFVKSVAAGCALGPASEIVTGPWSHQAAAHPGHKHKMAVVTTEWRYRSHAWHMAERFLTGYPLQGRWYRAPFEVISAYVDQRPGNDLSRARAEEFGFKIYPTIGEALRNGTDDLAVDAVLVIGEHGDYPLNEFGQKQYPRYEFFKKIVEVFDKEGRSLPVFSDKHLSWNFEYAKEMVEISHKMGFPLMAGSSLPCTWRMPSIDMPLGAEVEEVMCVAMGMIDIYDFHALETIQCMAERRKGGETGVAAVQALRGDAVWKAMEAGSWAKGGWDPDLFEACLCRSQTLTQPPHANHRYPSPEQIRGWVKDPVLYRVEYNDGLKSSMLLLNGLVGDFTFAARIKDQAQPLSTLFYLPPTPNTVYSAALMSRVAGMFETGKPPYPIERTLLTSGLVQAGMQSLSKGQKRLATPHLKVVYQPYQESAFWRS